MLLKEKRSDKSRLDKSAVAMVHNTRFNER
jgi:hypothetical protein